MPASQQYIASGTPSGATLVGGGATFRTWAPHAQQVYVVLDDAGDDTPLTWSKNDADLLVKDAHGYWSGFFPSVKDGDLYRFWIVGQGPRSTEGFKRDPYARELQVRIGDWYPCNCIVRDAARYRWHDAHFTTPDFSNLIIYQFHIGVFYAQDNTGQDIRQSRVSKILDSVGRIEYWKDLGVNAVMSLPFQEYQGSNSLGYNGTDLFSPEMDYSVFPSDLPDYLPRVNRLLAAKGAPPLTIADLTGQINQFKVFVDLCHLYDIAVIADVVYNHAGSAGNNFNYNLDDQSICFFDRQKPTEQTRLYFTDQEHVGPIFDFSRPEVRQFLIDNAKMHLQEYHLDGLRYDQVTVIDENGGWHFCQDLTNTLRYDKPGVVQIAEYWNYDGGQRWKAVAQPPHGMGFDLGYSDVMRQTVRKVIQDSAQLPAVDLNLDELRTAMYFTYNADARWTVFQCVENHDLLDERHHDRQKRIASLSDPSDARSWYARSRAKVATGLLLTSPGVPMIFMGQEFLEDKFWDDDPNHSQLFIWWEGLEGKDKHMSDQHRFTRELVWLRRKHPALRGEGLNVFHVHNQNRVIAFQRWVPNVGRDVVVVVSLNVHSFRDKSYRLGFPSGGHWQEVFNSDLYDNYFNPNVLDNYGGVTADGPAWDGLPASANITLPANSILVFARDYGDAPV